MLILEISYLFFQQYWWFIISLLGALLTFLLFVQGGQTLIYTVGKTETERKMLINTLGRKWEFTFTTLVTFGGAFFASFPLFYSVSFGGAYWVWTALLLAFTIQAVSYEYRSKKGNVFGAKFFELLLLINGLFGTILIGVIVGTFFNGAEYSINMMNNVEWQNNTRGLEALLSWHNLSLGFAIFFLARVLGLLYFANTISHTIIYARIRKKLVVNSSLFLIFFISFMAFLLIKDGYAVDIHGVVFLEKNKYLHNFIKMPVLLIAFIVGVLAFLWGIIITIMRKEQYDKGFWFSSTGTILVVLAIFLLAGYNNTVFYPSYFDLQSSLTITNSSASLFTLKIMSIVSLIIPFVFAYIVIAWRAINKKKINEQEINDKKEFTY